MEGDDGIISTVRSSSPPPPPPPTSDTEIITVGSLSEDLGFHEEAVTVAEVVPSIAAVTLSSSSSSSSTVTTTAAAATTPTILTDDLKAKIIRQVEYYFSDENLPTDKFLMKYVRKDKAGFVPVAVVASFRKMKKLVQDKSLVVAALRESSHLILSSDGKKVRRIHPLPITEVKDAKACTVVVENLPEDCSTEMLKRIFGDVGNVMSVCIRDPHATEVSSKASKEEMAVSGKIHALVEFETVKEAEKAVATLNDEKSWRNGMRVEFLLRRMGKYGPVKKAWKVVSEKNDKVPASHIVGDEQRVNTLDHHDERPGKVRDHRDERPGKSLEQRVSTLDHHDERPGKVRDHRDERPGKSLDHHDERLGKVRDHRDERPGKSLDYHDERLGKVRNHRDERPGRLLDQRDERPGKLLGHHDERLGKVRDHRDERPGRLLDHRDERPGKLLDHHDERLGKVRDHRDERPGKLLDHRDERPGKVLDHRDGRTGKEEGNHSLDEKVGRNRRSRGRGQFRAQKQINASGQGHGSAPRSEGFCKPPPGPKMPDGTRGFTMGRGRPPPPSNHNHE